MHQTQKLQLTEWKCLGSSGLVVFIPVDGDGGGGLLALLVPVSYTHLTLPTTAEV